MGLDLRIPLGLLFVITGLILLGYGAATLGNPMYQRSMGENVNLGWGAILALFGGAMLLLAWRARRNTPVRSAGTAAAPQRHH